MLGRLHLDEIEDLLHRQHVGRLACVVAGRPYIVPVAYAYARDAVYVHTLPGTKLGAMRLDPHVCFEVEERAGEATWGSVVAEGVFEELTEHEERQTALRLLERAKPVVVPPRKEIADVVFRLRLTTKTGRFVVAED